MTPRCSACGRPDDDRRFGICFDCASDGEARAARRTVREHLAKARENLRAGKLEFARYDLSWAWQRLTRTGDYAPGGYFEETGIDIRRH